MAWHSDTELLLCWLETRVEIKSVFQLFYVTSFLFFWIVALVCFIYIFIIYTFIILLSSSNNANFHHVHYPERLLTLWFICFYLFLYVFDEISHILVDLTVISELEKKIKKYQRNNQLIIEHSNPENLYPPPVKT